MTEEVLTSTILTERLGIIAEKIGISKDEILKKLPHYFDTKPFSLESVDEKTLPDYIDHTILKTNATAKDIERLVKEAVENNFYAICVNGCRAALAKELIEKEKAKVKLAVVIGFPLGAMTTKAKIFESQEMVDMQVDELDMVMNVGKFLDGDYKYVYEDIRGIVEICKNTKTTVKVILEISQLTPVQILDASIISVLAGAAFIKTSTGFVGGGATKDAVRIMKHVAGDVAKVKASGGVRTKEDAIDYIKLGVSRIGTSSGLQIVGKK